MTDRIAKNCANWKMQNDALGVCNACGAQSQLCQVGSHFRCPHFIPRQPTIGDSDGDDGA